MSKFVKTLVWLNLGVLTVLAVVYANLMVSPGPVSDGHAQLQNDCFACHTPFLGATAENCISCHKVADIGLRTTKGKPVIKKDPQKKAVAFHQKLADQDCTGCHTDHKGLKVYRRYAQFSHDLLEPKVAEQCASCHEKPVDKIHEKASTDCLQCHVKDKWKPATFKHENLPPAQLQQCVNCHKLPTDKLHESTSDKCVDCHLTSKWKPATFKHENLPPAQLQQCVNCHKLPTDKLHESTSDKCVDCHLTSKWEPATFKHESLPRAELRNCVACHERQRPDDRRHREASKRCGNCHYSNKWKPAKERNRTGSSSSTFERRTTRPSSSSPSDGSVPQWWLEQRKARENRR